MQEPKHSHPTLWIVFGFLAIGVIVLSLVLAAVASDKGSGELIFPERKPLVLTPKDKLPVIDAQEGVHWTHAPQVPPPIERDTQIKLVVKWKVSEFVGDLDPAHGVKYTFWGFGGRIDDEMSVPGPLLRVREGDLIRIELTNDLDSTNPHNIDFHFVLGQGGGAPTLNVIPGETAILEVRAMNPGFYMYHCATSDIPTHIANGMYGFVIVEPRGGLPKVDHELYVVQSEFYPKSTEPGIQPLDMENLDAEHPSYVVFNGSVGAMAGENSPKIKVGDSVRLYVGNGGPQLISSFHVIGEIFDRVYREGDLISPPAQSVQTTLIPAGGGSVVEFTVDVPGTYILVDHAIARALHKGAVATIIAEGNANHEIFESINRGSPRDDDHNGHGEKPIPTATPESRPTPTSPSETRVNILPGAVSYDNDRTNDYLPNEITIRVGTKVTWVNNDNTVHTVTADNGSFDSRLLRKGQSWNYTFTKPGIYEYHCDPHPWMKGKVIVQ